MKQTVEELPEDQHVRATSVTRAGRRRGRPKVAWTVFADELWRRARNDETPPTAHAAATVLEAWARERGVKTVGNKPASTGAQAIYRRLCPRLGGALNYGNFVVWLKAQDKPPSVT